MWYNDKNSCPLRMQVISCSIRSKWGFISEFISKVCMGNLYCIHYDLRGNFARPLASMKPPSRSHLVKYIVHFLCEWCPTTTRDLVQHWGVDEALANVGSFCHSREWRKRQTFVIASSMRQGCTRATGILCPSGYWYLMSLGLLVSYDTTGMPHLSL